MTEPNITVQAKRDEKKTTTTKSCDGYLSSTFSIVLDRISVIHGARLICGLEEGRKLALHSQSLAEEVESDGNGNENRGETAEEGGCPLDA